MQGHSKTSRRFGGARLFRYGVGACVLALSAGVMPAHAQRDLPSIVIDIARFTEWPDDAAEGLSFRLCLRDDDPAIGTFLAAEGRTVKGRPITVHSIAPTAFTRRPCHAAFFSRGYGNEDVIGQLGRLPVLTVSNDPGFAARGGLIELADVGAAVTFLIDEQTVVRHPLSISAQVLDMAREVPER